MKCCLRFLPSLALVIACLGMEAVAAQMLPRTAGYVARVIGEAYVTSLDNTNLAAVGQAIVEGMTLHTGAAGGLAVILEDGTVLSFGPNSRFTLEEYRFLPASETFRMSARIRRGTLSLEPGSIARLDPNAISLTTPHGRIAVHAGHVLLKVIE